MGVPLPEFIEWKEKKWVPLVRRSGVKLIGLWYTVVGQTGKFHEIWALENYTEMDSMTKYLYTLSNEEDKQTLAELSKYEKDRYVELMRGTSLSPTKDLNDK
jgi:hypothetical protein